MNQFIIIIIIDCFTLFSRGTLFPFLGRRWPTHEFDFIV